MGSTKASHGVAETPKCDGPTREFRLQGLLGGVNATNPHLLKEERQFVTVWGQSLGVQRSMKTQTQSPTGVGRVLQRGFLRGHTALENPALSDSVTAPSPPKAWGGTGPNLGRGPGAGQGLGKVDPGDQL